MLWKSDRGLDLPAFYQELGWEPHEIPRRLNVNKGWVGCACKDWGQFYRWFDLGEISILSSYGFRAVEFEPDEILFETLTQVVFRHNRPLRMLFDAARLNPVTPA